MVFIVRSISKESSFSKPQKKQKQTNRDFDQLKEENQDLYRQVGTLQRKHDKQQDTVDRLISFMIHFIQQSGGVS